MCAGYANLLAAMGEAAGVEIVVVVGDAFVREYEASYFMTPPEVFGLSHFPDDPKWQLVAASVSRGEFLRWPDVK